MFNALCFRSFIRQLIDADIVKRVDRDVTTGMENLHPDLGVGRFVLTDPDIDIDLDEDVDCTELDPLMGGKGGRGSGNTTDSTSEDDDEDDDDDEIPAKQPKHSLPKVVELQSSGDEADGAAEAGKKDGAPPDANGERKEMNGFPKKKKRRKDEENNFSNFVGHEIIDGEDEDDGKDAHLDELMDGLDEAVKPVVLSDSGPSDGMPSDMDSSDDEPQVRVVEGSRSMVLSVPLFWIRRD